MQDSTVMALIGGALIGLATSLMLLLNGRIAGISGILGGAISARRNDFLWRALFLLGLIVGGGVAFKIAPSLFANTTSTSIPMIIIAGVCVGFGTSMGNGCTSGHGVCGVARLSPRSLIATGVFMLVGILTATFIRPYLNF
jgi:uncharacterized membrane protein YedE/YeeE